MGNLTDNENDPAFQRNMMTSFVQIAALVILVSYCLVIIGPFVGLAIWGIVLAVAIYPLHLKLSTMLGGRQKLAVTLFVIVGLVPVGSAVGAVEFSGQAAWTSARGPSREDTN